MTLFGSFELDFKSAPGRLGGSVNVLYDRVQFWQRGSSMGEVESRPRTTAQSYQHYRSLAPVQRWSLFRKSPSFSQ